MRRLRFALTATTALVFLTVLLGVATKAAGAGLACEARWPLCDGGLLNLFPATVPSFFEWIHRVVAGVTGLAILGTAALAWQSGAPRSLRYAPTAGLLLTPVQVFLGRQTVTVFSEPILAAHYWVAMGIFGSFVVGTALAWRSRLGPAHARAALGVAAVFAVLQVAVGPLVVDTYTQPVQALHYGVTLLSFAGVVVGAVAGWEAFGPERYAVVLALALAPVIVSLGRSLTASPGLAGAYATVATLSVLALVAAAVAVPRRGTPSLT